MQWSDSLLSLILSLIGIGIVYGIFKTKIIQLERDIKRVEAELSNATQLYVTYRHFEAVIGRIQGQQDEMQKDIKQILGYVKK